MNVAVDFRIFVNANHSVFSKKYYNVNEIKTKYFFENRKRTLVENAIILTCTKIQRKILIFGEVGAPESCFWD